MTPLQEEALCPLPLPIERKTPNPLVQAEVQAYLERRERRSAYQRAYRSKHRERILAAQRRYAAKKRAERTHYLCRLKYAEPLRINLPAVPTIKPRPRKDGHCFSPQA